VLDTFETVRLCVAYELDGRRITHLPEDQSALHHVIPVYEDLPGWSTDLTGCTEPGDLPARARDYLDRLEAEVGVPVSLVGVGPGREQFVQRVP
jgi:adenylosuccinate synthase